MAGLGATAYLITSPTRADLLSQLLDRLQLALGDSYRLERELGGGGMSHVFLATEASLNRHVVIKLLPPEMVSDVSAARFKREMELTAQLHHPHILPVLSAGARDDLMFYVMPYVQGESLRHRLGREKQLPVGDALRILREIADALAFAHRHGVVHRDVKPENILLEDGHAVLADFGVARALISAGAENLTGTGMAVGTPGYMAPEQMTGEKNIDARADVYALALVGYEMLAGHPPFSGASAKAIVTAHLTTPPVPLTEIRPEVPASASAAIARGLAKEPDDRFQTAAAFRDALDAAVVGAAVAASKPAPRSRVPRLAGIAAVAAIAVAIAVGVVRYRGGAAKRLDANVLVVAPFNVLSPDLALWKEGIVDLLARNMDGAGPIRTVSPSVIVQGWSGHADRQSTSDLARRTGAGIAVFGTLEKFGRDSVRAAATMLDANSGNVLSELRRTDHADRMDRLVDSLTVGLLRELGRTRPVSAVKLAGVGSSSLPALKYFLQGEQYFRRTQFDSAAMSYEQAVRQDSTFALALYRAGTVRGWVQGINDTIASDLVGRAGAHLKGLGARDSLIILSDSLGRAIARSNENVLQNPKLPEQVRRLFEITTTLEQRYPTDPDAWYAIGEARFHHGTRLGRRQPRRSILDAFDRAIAADSGYAPAYIHAIDLAYELGSPDDGLVYVRRYNALTSSDMYAEGMRLVEKLTDPAQARLPETQQALEGASTAALQRAAIALMHATDSTEAALRILREGSGRTSGFQGRASRLSAQAMTVEQAMYRGHMREARQLLQQTPALLRETRTAFAIGEAAYFDLWPADSTAALAARVSDTAVVARGFLAITQQDSAAMARILPRLKARAQAGGVFAAELAKAIEALNALREADTTTALQILDSIGLSSADEPLLRMFKAELLLSRNRAAEAVDVVRDGFTCGCAAQVLFSLMRGKVAEAAGDRELAIESYSFVTNAWRKADPEMQQYVTQAREGLKRLGGDERRALKL